MFTGRSVILVMVALGVLLIAGYEFVRRAALPSGVSEVKDLGGTERFDKVYTFEGTRYHVRVGTGEGLSATGTISIATLADDGSNATSIIHPRTGPIREVHFLDVEVDGPPALAVILDQSLESRSADGLVFTLEGDTWIAEPLGPLPDAIVERYIGFDRFELLGAFLYREVRLEPLIDGDDPVDVRCFYDWRHRRWELSD